MVTTTCHCKKAKAVPRRCSAKEWSCRLPCGRTLLCGQHVCENPCHAGRPTFLKFQSSSCFCCLFYMTNRLLLEYIILLQFLLSVSLCNCIQEIVSLVHVSVNNSVSVGDRQQRGFVQALNGSVIRYVEAILLNRFLTFIKFDYFMY